MTWPLHKLTSFSMVYLVTGDATASIVAGAASVLPDAIEFPFRGLIPHRTITHWPYLYIVLIVISAMGFFFSGHVLFFLALCVGVGCLLHVAEDALSKTGVPYLGPFGPKKGFDFYKVYTVREWLTALAIIVPCLLGAHLMGRTDQAYIAAEVQKMFYVSGDISRLLLNQKFF